MRRLVRFGSLVCLSFALLFQVCPPAEARPRLRPVRIRDADTLFLPGNVNLNAYPRLNNRNQVVFINNIFVAGKFYSRLWDNGHLYPLGGETGYDRVTARGLNDSGEVTGEVQYVVNDTSRVHAFVTVDGQIQVLQSSPDEATIGYSINNSGTVTGRSIAPPSSTTLRAIRWDGGGRTTIGPLPAHPTDSQHYDFPLYINDLGTMAGNVFLTYSAFSTYHRHGFYGTQGSLTEVEPFAGGYTLYLWDINNQGQMVGESNGVDAVPPGGGHTHAILVDGGQKKDIHGTIFAASVVSRAYAINDSGAAVGWRDGGKGFYYENDTTWLLDSLLVTRAFPGGGTLNTLWEGVDINNSGVILALYNAGGFSPLYPCLLVPVDSGTIVNTDNDLPDLNPNDGRCYTGNITSLGEDECSFRAAIQHTNAQVGADTIRFRIPGGGVPLVAVTSPLPAVTERVNIDATTQPGSHQVEVIPSDSLMGGDGLVLTADNCILRGLLLNRFTGSGLVLDSADFCHIDLCHFGVRSDSTTAAGNGTAGVFILNSDGNQFGTSSPDDEPNFIAYNNGPGILVASGFDNRFGYNHIFRNGGLGIDLFPPGVTRNDPLDADFGANGLTNYPYFDSVIASSGTTRIHGTMPAGNTHQYSIEVYRSDTCDPSGYGEGQAPVAFTTVMTLMQQEADFEAVFSDTLLPGEVLTMTATSISSGTSEFSPCWPAPKRLHLVDGQGVPIAHRLFALSTVANDPPIFTETLVDTVTTDSTGTVDVQEYYDAGQLHAEDSVKLSKVLDYTPRFKAGPPITDRCMTIYLDNGKFDSTDYHYYFDELDREPDQVVRLSHTTVGLNLVVSVEWEADNAYFQTTQTGLRDLSNYLYDVYDGQVRLDTVFLYNNAEMWKYADIQVHASNTLRPQAYHHGVFEMNKYLLLCRRWFGSPPQQTVEQSLIEYPMEPYHINHVRTIGHELGHYLFNFHDEYFENDARRCSPFHFYGFMDAQYPSREPSASEMSWAQQYSNGACRNNRQYLANGKSCWDQWEQAYQLPYNGVHGEILKPSERMAPGANDFFFGPNDYGSSVQYDVGALVQFQTHVSSRTTVDKRVYLRAQAGALAGVDVALWKGNTGRIIEQGHTASSGGLWVLGATTGDSLFASSGRRRSPFRRAAAAADSDHVWYSAIQEWVSGPGDSAEMVATEAAGYLPANCQLELGAGDATLSLDYLNAFDLAPALQFWSDPDSGLSALLPTSAIAGAYQVTLPIVSEYSGSSLVRALDTAGVPFAFGVDVVVLEVSAGSDVRVNSADGASYLDIDSVEQDGRLSLVTSNYLPLRAGVDENAHQLGHSASLSAFPATAFDSGLLVITYGEFDLSAAEPPFDEEATVRIFAWDDTGNQWTLLGGDVDTQANLVSATVPGPGLYAAFTTGQITDVGDEHQGAITPETYGLAQNHPNPFNPSTTISYYLPQPGRVTLRIHNILGQTVRTIVNEVRSAGAHEAVWDGRTAAGAEAGSGVYFYSLRAGDVVLTRKMVLMK